jgi:hypothetical protein
MATREKAIEAYRQLKQKFKDTMLVRHAAARIDRRIDSGKEYYFLAPDLSAGGTFSLTKDRTLRIARRQPQLGGVGIPRPAVDDLPLLGARGRLLRRGLHASLPGHRIDGAESEDEEARPAEPAASSRPREAQPKNLKPAHPKGEPQKPTRWEWIEIVLPRSSAAGLRQLRLLTDLKGVGVSAVLVSATKGKPPSDAEAAELVKTRALDAVPSWFSSKSGGVPRLFLDDFDRGVAGWNFHNGANSTR